MKAPEGVKIKFATNFTVAVVSAPEKEEVVAPVAAVPGAVPAEGAAVPAPGAAPAAGAAPAPGAAPAAPAPAAGAKGAPAKGEAKGGKK